MNSSADDLIPPDVAADNQAVIDHVLSGRPLDHEIACRVQERARPSISGPTPNQNFSRANLADLPGEQQ